MFSAVSLSLAGLAAPGWGALTFTCAPNVSSTACAYLNNTVAGLYNNTFSNLNASVYVELGNTGLGMSSYFLNFITYSQYVAALTSIAQSSGNSMQASAVNALYSLDTSLYGNYMVNITSPLGKAFGISGMFGSTAAGNACSTPGTSTCFDGVITISNSVPLYYRQGTEARDAYDFYSTVEHETDEILGTASCVDTTGRSLSNGCIVPGVDNVLAAVDLFRYQSAGNLVLISTTPGAYFSYNGGQTNGAGTYKKIYNTLDNGDDYGDFISGNSCQAQQSIQDAVGCPGFDGGLDITNDGGAEINILNAVGFTVASQGTQPAPVIKTGGIVPVYSTSTTVQPGEWISIYGANLGPASPVNWNGNFPTTLGGTSVTIDGEPAYLYYVSSSQLNVQVPNDNNIGRSVPVVVSVGTQSVTSSVNLASVAPSFSLLADGVHIAGIIVRTDGSGTYGNGTYDIIGPVNNSPGYKTVPAQAGDNIQLYGVGFGPTTPFVSAGQLFSGAASTTDAVTLSINNQPVVASFTGLSEAGTYQFDLKVPAGLGTGDVPVVAGVAGAETQNGVMISLQ